ncbi:uncharacterized protein YdcI [Athalia rosae]|uniref:uncharacterized protein YdcI n=1 Tax=Athalia rosae TaxID=37344 RepID=UPI0020348B52|nr:uncharacterized protein YdcI [Athalia rosae]
MNRNLRKRKALIIIDDNDSEDEDTNSRRNKVTQEDDSDLEVVYTSSQQAKGKHQIPIAVNDGDKPKQNAIMIDEDTTTCKTILKDATRNRITMTKQKRQLMSSKEITIDDESDEGIDLKNSKPMVIKRKKKESSDTISIKKQTMTVIPSSSKKESSQEMMYTSSQQAKGKHEISIAVNDGDKPKQNAIMIDKDTATCKAISKDATRNRITVAKQKRQLMSSKEVKIDAESNEGTDLKNLKPTVIKRQKKESSDIISVKKQTVRVKPSSSKKESSVLIEEKDALLGKAENEKFNDYETDNFDGKLQVEWSESEYLSEFNNIDRTVAENIISLFEQDNTIPFIARYRKDMTRGMEPEQLRSIKNTWDNLKAIKQRAMFIMKTIDKLGKWSPEIHSAVRAAKSLNELEHIYAPFKSGTKRSYAERARELGLTPLAENILKGRAIGALSSFIDPNRAGLNNEAEVKQGIVHIIADVISKDRMTFEGIHELRKSVIINIETCKSKATSSLKHTNNKKFKADAKKYEKYYNFVSSEKIIKDYEILAINRGESQKILTVKISIPDWFQHKLKEICLKKYNFVRKVSNFHHHILEESFEDAYIRLIKPLVIRQVRHDLNENAESASIEVFARNLKKLLLIPPLRGKTVLGVDPGFTQGCKLAVVSPCGNVLDTATIYPHTRSRSNINEQVKVLGDLIKKYNCTIVALGNATACRETEILLSNLIQAGTFAPLDVSYTIVNEAGASVYSCGSEAKSEFPDLDPNIISAISIARRLQDPLAELVKVEPKHLGIGMYQHDLPEKRLQLTLGEVISETVSFVGVDINTASHCLLRRVAGLNASRAASIIEKRKQCGPFQNRQQLLKVKGIGKKSFEQCAGFIRILPETAGIDLESLKECSFEYLDQTWIHPESYNIAKRFVKFLAYDLTELGSEQFHAKMSFYANNENYKIFAEQFGTSETSMDVIIKGLMMKKGEDIRIKEDAPLYRKNLRCINDLSVHINLTGSVRNVTNFGTFVDVGVGRDGLIPISKLNGQILSLGQRVEVTVLSIDKQRERIVLMLAK